MRYLFTLFCLYAIPAFSQQFFFKTDIYGRNLDKDKMLIARSVVMAIEHDMPEVMNDYIKEETRSLARDASSFVQAHYTPGNPGNLIMLTEDTTARWENVYYRFYSQDRFARNAIAVRVEIEFSPNEFDLEVKEIRLVHGFSENLDENSVLNRIQCGRPPPGGKYSAETIFDFETRAITPISREIKLEGSRDVEKITGIRDAKCLELDIIVNEAFQYFHHLDELWESKAIRSLRISNYRTGSNISQHLDKICGLRGLKRLELRYGNTGRYYKNPADVPDQPHELPICLSELESLEHLDISNYHGEIPADLGRLTNLRSLHLSGRFKTIPESFRELKLLENLRIRNYAIEALPAAIYELTNIQTLLLDLPRVITIPKGISKLRALRSLSLFNMELLESFPADMHQLKNLQSLYLVEMEKLPAITGKDLAQLDTLELRSVKDYSALGSYTGVSNLSMIRYPQAAFPEGLGRLKQLRRFTLSKAENLANFPVSITGFEELQYVSIGGAGLTTIPAWITGSPTLSFLNLRENKIRAIPKEIANLTSVAEINLIENEIEEIPAEILQLSTCHTIWLAYNPLRSVDADILAAKGTRKMRILFSEYSDLGKQLGNVSKIDLSDVSVKTN